jgi:RHS repeat-associated protein
VYAGSRLVSTETTVFHHPDRLGTKLTINQNTLAVDRQSTLPFGTALNAESTAFSNQVFTSYDRSASTGLDYAVNRTYSQGQGRFTQVDPIGIAAVAIEDPQSNNLYAYVQNSPADFVDPLGLDEETIDGGTTWASRWWEVLWSLYICGLERYYERPVESQPRDDFPGGGGQDPPPGSPCSTGNLRDDAGNPIVDGIVGEDGRCRPGPTASVEVSANDCGVNPVTGQPGINRKPYNKVGNLRSDSGGSGEWRARRGGGKRTHTGIDIFGGLGQPVVASWGGTVSVSRQMKGGQSAGYGRMVTIDHGNGWTTRYAHLSGFSVRSGSVAQGDQIGTLGQDGNARGTNPHVHYEIRYNGVPQNPVSILNRTASCPKI